MCSDHVSAYQLILAFDWTGSDRRCDSFSQPEVERSPWTSPVDLGINTRG